MVFIDMAIFVAVRNDRDRHRDAATEELEPF
ncbi:hypothetical protein Natoc_0025 [Natronococcus occultus SP4]|uniref:Uncharacterized protein n=1 Tax=Natronococcus occultus SP4 TaxID=694430 RepID=L0JVM6_9EURY|nr:hypothetical protein Natoc_0025 [Natronococcus occultus SP4]